MHRVLSMYIIYNVYICKTINIYRTIAEQSAAWVRSKTQDHCKISPCGNYKTCCENKNRVSKFRTTINTKRDLKDTKRWSVYDPLPDTWCFWRYLQLDWHRLHQHAIIKCRKKTPETTDRHPAPCSSRKICMAPWAVTVFVEGDSPCRESSFCCWGWPFTNVCLVFWGKISRQKQYE